MTTGYYTPYDSFYLTIWFILHENTTYVYTIYICTHTYPHIPESVRVYTKISLIGRIWKDLKLLFLLDYPHFLIFLQRTNIVL